MLPTELAKSDTEHAHQRAFFQWINFASRYGFEATRCICLGYVTPWGTDYLKRPELALMHAIPNGGSRHRAEASKLKAEGVKPGVPDTFLPVIRHHGSSEVGVYAGLYIEFKSPSRRERLNGGMSDAQVAYSAALLLQGYRFDVVYRWEEAANVVMSYYGVDTRFDVV